VLQCVALCCTVFQRAAVCYDVLQRAPVCSSVLQSVATCRRVLQCVAVARVSQIKHVTVAVCCSVLQSNAVCCSRSGCSSQSYVALSNLSDCNTLFLFVAACRNVLKGVVVASGSQESHMVTYVYCVAMCYHMVTRMICVVVCCSMV